MDDSKRVISLPKAIFGHSLNKKKSWLEDEFSLTPPDDSGFLALRFGYQKEKAAKDSPLCGTLSPNIGMAMENAHHGASHTIHSGPDHGVHLKLGSSEISLGDVHYSQHPNGGGGNLISVSTPGSERRRSSHDLTKRRPSEILVELPKEGVSSEQNQYPSSGKSHYNLVAKIDKYFGQRLEASDPEYRGGGVRGLSQKVSSFGVVSEGSEDNSENVASVDALSNASTQLNLQSSSPSLTRRPMGQEKKSLSNYYFTNSMFSAAANMTASDLVSGEQMVSRPEFSAPDSGKGQISRVGTQYSGAGADAFDGSQIKTPKKRPKPSSLREMNFWAPQSM